LFLMTSIGFRVMRDNLNHDPVTQEKLIAVFLFPLAIADVSLSIYIIPALTRR